MQQPKPDTADPMVVMGRIVAAQGILGWVKIRPYTEYLDSLMEYPFWFLGSETHPWHEVKVLECKPHTKVLVARLEGVNDRSAAEKCKGLQIAVPRSRLPVPAENEYYWSDLIGLQVVNLQGEDLGRVDHLLDMGANDILCVQRENGEILIPFLAHVVKQVNLEEKVICVDWQADY